MPDFYRAIFPLAHNDIHFAEGSIFVRAVLAIMSAPALVALEGRPGSVGFDDAKYADAGATLVEGARDIWRCELIVKVKELQPPEYRLLARGTTIFGYAQLARDRELVDVVLRAGVRIIAYELVRDAAGALPLLAPMSRIAGRLAPFARPFAEDEQIGK